MANKDYMEWLMSLTKDDRMEDFDSDSSEISVKSTSGTGPSGFNEDDPQPSTSAGITRNDPPGEEAVNSDTSSEISSLDSYYAEHNAAIRAFNEAADGLDEEFLPVTSTRMPASKKRPNSPVPIDADEPARKKTKTMFAKSMGIGVHVMRTHHRQEQQFGFMDDMYKVKFIPDAHEVPTIISVFLGIATALNMILNQVREDSERGFDHLLYPCISDNRVKNGVNGGPVSLAMSNEDIINKLLDNLHHYLTSHQNMLISDSFQMSMKVLSQHHMRLRGLIGILQDTVRRPRKRPHKLPTPAGFKDHENAFLGQCAIVSCILALGYNEYHTKGDTKQAEFPLRQMTTFMHGNVLKIKNAGFWITNKLNHFLESKNLQRNSNGYQSDINKKMQLFFNCQIHIFCDKSSQFKVASYPRVYNPCMEQVYLLQTGDEALHYEAIINISKYFTSVRRRYCFDCNVIYTSAPNNWRHCCHKRKACLSCRRVVFSEDYWYLPKDKDMYCDQTENMTYGSCNTCKLDFRSKDCQEKHRRSECRRGIKCEMCSKYLTISGARQNQEQVIKKHVCGEKKCSDCYEHSTGANHICAMKKMGRQKEWQKISFFSLSFLKNEYNQPVPAQACLVYERERPGNFVVKMFHGIAQTIEKEGFENIYWPNDCDRKLNENGTRANFGKCKNLPSYLADQDDSTPENVTKKVLLYLFDKNQKFQNTTFVMPTYADLLSVISALVGLKLYPNVLRKDSKILSVSPKDINIRFVCYLNYQAISASTENQFFPLNLKLTDLDRQNITLTYNDLQDFNDSGTVKELKMEYIDTLTNNYSFQVDGLDFLYDTTIALARSCLIYIKDSFDLQKEVIHHLATSSMTLDNPGTTKDMTLLNPLSAPFVSNGAFIYGVFRLFVLNGFEIACIPKENIGLSNNNVSQGEAQYVYWLNRNKNYRAFYNHIDGQTREFRILHPDAYDRDTDTVYFYNGCFTHKHAANQCLTYKGKGKAIAKNPLKRKSELPNEESFESKRQRFEEAYPDINVIVQWECKWKREMREPEVKSWFDNHPWAKDPPQHRLIPRDAVRGGSSETYNFLWSKTRNPDETLVYADVISQYPDIALKYDFPVEQFEVIIGEKLNNIVVANNALLLGNRPLYGLIFLSIEAPKDLEFPFLTHRTKDSISVAALCKTCAQDQTLTVCKHEGMQRFITGNYTTIEINYALSLGYVIKHIYEVWHWDKKAPIYKTFMQLLLRKKIMFSGYPDNHETESDREAYCSKVNQTLNLTGSLALETKDITYDKRLKDYFKHLTVAAVGKVGQGNLFPMDIFANNNDIVREHFYKDDNESLSDAITDTELINKDTLYLRVKPSKETAPTNRTGNCVIQAMITAQARIGMHKTLLSVVNSGCKVFSVEADAIVFSHKKTNKCPIQFGNQVGEFKEEYKDIESYSTLGPKTSRVTYHDGETKKNVVKVKGLNLTGEIASGCVDSDVYEKQVIDLLHGIRTTVMVWQNRTRTTFPSCKQNTSHKEFAFCNWIMKNRKLCWDNVKGTHTMPYGYYC